MACCLGSCSGRRENGGAAKELGAQDSSGGLGGRHGESVGNRRKMGRSVRRGVFGPRRIRSLTLYSNWAGVGVSHGRWPGEMWKTKLNRWGLTVF
jgi:hypothetical protein